MAESHDLNPFAAPQSGKQAYTGEAESHPEAEVLQAVQHELSRMQFGIKTVACAGLAVAGFTLFQFLFEIIWFGQITSGMVNSLGIAFYGTAGVLAGRTVGRIKRFARHAQPFAMNQVFAAQAGFWKFLGITAVIFLVIIVPLVILSVLLLAAR